jgi:hypothetical protein
MKHMILIWIDFDILIFNKECADFDIALWFTLYYLFNDTLVRAQELAILSIQQKYPRNIQKSNQ